MAEFVRLMEGPTILFDPEDERIEELWESEEWLMQPVPEGRRYQCLLEEDGEFHFQNRDPESQLPQLGRRIGHIVDELRTHKLPPNTLIDGFIVSRTNDSILTSQMIEQSEIGSLRLQQEHGQLEYLVWDVIFLKDEELFEYPLFDRRLKMTELFKKRKCVRLIEGFDLRKKEAYDKMKEHYRSFTFKQLGSSYHFGRIMTWKVLRRTESHLVVITDVNEGKGRFTGMCGSLGVGQYMDGELRRITNISGLDNDDRLDFFRNRDQYVGRVIEIKASGRSDDNFFDARYYRLRFDKKPEDCVFERQ